MGGELIIKNKQTGERVRIKDQVHTFIIKSVNAINRGAFVISPHNEEIFRILDLVG